MAKPCVAKDSQRGMYVQSWSGYSNKVICDVKNHSDVRHYVKIENLRLYPAKVKCKGIINTGAKVIEFSSTNPADTTTVWQAVINPLGSGLPFTFSPCILRPVSGASGTDIIVTEVVIEWYQPGKRQSVSLSIAVSA